MIYDTFTHIVLFFFFAFFSFWHITVASLHIASARTFDPTLLIFLFIYLHQNNTRPVYSDSRLRSLRYVTYYVFFTHLSFSMYNRGGLLYNLIFGYEDHNNSWLLVGLLWPHAQVAILLGGA